MSVNEPEKELTGFFLKRFFEQAKGLQSKLKPGFFYGSIAILIIIYALVVLITKGGG